MERIIHGKSPREGLPILRASQRRDAERDREPRPRNFVVDLSRTSYLDSSALGMLLILREHAGADAEVTLANPAPAVREILKLSNFDQLFKIS